MKKELCGHLIVEGLKGQEQKLELHADTVITIGRSHDNDVRLSDDTVSHRHAELRIKLDGAQYQNQGRNGSIVNGSIIYDPAWISLADGAVIAIGGYRLRLELLARDLTRIASRTVVMPSPLQPSDNPAKTMIMPSLSGPIKGDLATGTGKKAGRLDDAAKTMFFPTPSGPLENSLEGGDPARTMFFPAPSSQNKNQPAVKAASRSGSGDKKQGASSLPPSDSNEPKRAGLSSGFLKTPIGKVSVALIVIIVASFAFSLSQNDEPAVAEPKVQSKSEATKRPATPAASSVAGKTVVPISEDEFERAKLLFQSAEKLFTERKLNQRNLYDAMQKWRESRMLLEKNFAAADQNTLLAKRMLDEQIEVWKNEAVINFKKKDFKACHTLLQNIMAAVPAIEDSSYRWAKDRESKVLSEMKRAEP